MDGSLHVQVFLFQLRRKISKTATAGNYVNCGNAVKGNKKLEQKIKHVEVVIWFITYIWSSVAIFLSERMETRRDNCKWKGSKYKTVDLVLVICMSIDEL